MKYLSLAISDKKTGIITKTPPPTTPVRTLAANK